MNARTILQDFNACRTWLLPAMVEDPEDEVLNDLLINHAQLWRGEKSAMVTRLIAPDQLHVWLGGGSLRELLAMIPGVAAWGRMQGAKWATITGRPGWARVLAKLGFEDRDGDLWKAL